MRQSLLQRTGREFVQLLAAADPIRQQRHAFVRQDPSAIEDTTLGVALVRREIPLEVEGTVRNLLGQTITLSFQEVREPGAIYYLATTRFTDREALRFELTVEDLERGERHALSFQKTLWAQ